MWPTARIALFLLKLAALVPALFWVWAYVQSAYTALVTSIAHHAVAIEERPVGVTRLEVSPSGEAIDAFSELRTDGAPAYSYDAQTLHFYVVPALAVVLAFPGLGLWKRLRALAITLGLVILFQTIALVVAVEYTYAVVLTEIAGRNYSPAAQRIYTWLFTAFAFIAVQGVPGAVVVFLAAWYGPLGRGHSAPEAAGDHAGGDTMDRDSARTPFVARGAGLDATSEASRSIADARIPRWALKAAAAALLLLGGAAFAAGAWAHRGKIVRRQAETLCVWGQRALARGDFLHAEDFFARSIRLNPSFKSSLAGLGAALLQRGDAAGASRAYDQAIQLDPADAHAYAGLGESLARSGDYAGAASAFREAIRRDGSVMEWHRQLATALVVTQRMPEAEKVFLDVIERWPSDHNTRLNFSKLLANAGRYCEMVPHLEVFLTLAPNDPDAGVVRQTLDFARPRCPAR